MPGPDQTTTRPATTHQVTGAFASVRLHVVTGKGGVGKSTVAAALALAVATGGRKVLLTEVEDRQGIAGLFGLPPLPYEERRIASAPGGGELYGLAIDPEEALLDYLEMFYNLRRAGKALRKLGAVDFATTIAPGMRDVLLTGKVKEAVTRQDRPGHHLYDAVVLDAPPTGRIARFLNVSDEVAGLARTGPIRGQADSVMGVVRSAQTAVHLVTILEEMPVQETVDGVEELRSVDLPVGGLVVNMMRPDMLRGDDLRQAREGHLDQAELAAAVREGGLELAADTVAVLAQEATDHARRIELEHTELARLDALGRPSAALPLLGEGVDVGGLYRLAELLRDQGLVA